MILIPCVISRIQKHTSAWGFASEQRERGITRYFDAHERATDPHMANDAFALSPISASGTLPSEADYHAISEAFMETARGRWFLKEYARRNRNTDTAMVLEAVSRIETTIAMPKRQAPVGGLAEAMEVIRTIISEASAAASRATDHMTSDNAFAPSRKGVRIIRE